jgi:hypothetical protein
MLIASYVWTELTRLFRLDAALVLQVAKQVSPVIVGLEALRTLVRLLFGGGVGFFGICKRKNI